MIPQSLVIQELHSVEINIRQPAFARLALHAEEMSTSTTFTTSSALTLSVKILPTDPDN